MLETWFRCLKVSTRAGKFNGAAMKILKSHNCDLTQSSLLFLSWCHRTTTTTTTTELAFTPGIHWFDWLVLAIFEGTDSLFSVTLFWRVLDCLNLSCNSTFYISNLPPLKDQLSRDLFLQPVAIWSFLFTYIL